MKSNMFPSAPASPISPVETALARWLSSKRSPVSFPDLHELCTPGLDESKTENPSTYQIFTPTTLDVNNNTASPWKMMKQAILNLFFLGCQIFFPNPQLIHDPMKSSSAGVCHLKTASQAASTAAASFSNWKEYLAPGANAGWMDDMVVIWSISMMVSISENMMIMLMDGW